jgi:hypothetical protein
MHVAALAASVAFRAGTNPFNASARQELRPWATAPLRCRLLALTMPSITWRPWLRRGGAGLLLTLGIAYSAALAACGGEGKRHTSAQGLLDRAFRMPVRSADVSIDAQIEVQGVRGLDRPVRLEASGPYVNGTGGLPQLDVDLDVGVQGAGQTVQSGLLSTGDRAFLKFGGQYYEQPEADVRRANDQLGRAGEPGRGALPRLGLHPRRWVVGARREGRDQVAGVRTEHLSGRLDVRAMLTDLSRLAERSANAIGGSLVGPRRRLPLAGLHALEGAVEDAKVDVYVGSKDHLIRRLSTSLNATVPKRDRARLGGVRGGSLSLSLELADVNGRQEVEPPAKARPIAALTKQLGGLSGLGVAAIGKAPAGTRDGGARGGSARGGGAPPGGAPNPGSLRRYSACLDRTKPSDTRSLSRCADLLR